MNSIVAFIINFVHSLLHLFAKTCGAGGEAAECDSKSIVSASDEKGKENNQEDTKSHRPHHRKTSISKTTTTTSTFVVDTVSGSSSPEPNTIEDKKQK